MLNANNTQLSLLDAQSAMSLVRPQSRRIKDLHIPPENEQQLSLLASTSSESDLERQAKLLGVKPNPETVTLVTQRIIKLLRFGWRQDTLVERVITEKAWDQAIELILCKARSEGMFARLLPNTEYQHFLRCSDRNRQARIKENGGNQWRKTLPSPPETCRLLQICDTEEIYALNFEGAPECLKSRRVKKIRHWASGVYVPISHRSDDGMVEVRYRSFLARAAGFSPAHKAVKASSAHQLEMAAYERWERLKGIVDNHPRLKGDIIAKNLLDSWDLSEAESHIHFSLLSTA